MPCAIPTYTQVIPQLLIITRTNNKRPDLLSSYYVLSPEVGTMHSYLTINNTIR